MLNPAPDKVIDELMEKVTIFKKAYLEDGLTAGEFAGFGPVVRFRNQFIDGWQYLLDDIKERRDINS